MPQQPKWDPMRELAGIQKQMNKLVESAMARTDFKSEGGIGSWEPLADVCELDDNLIVSLELPGIDQENIDVRVDDDELVVEGERKMEREQPGEQFHRVERSYGVFHRRFRLPSSVDRESIQASYRDGVLRITLNTRKASEPRAIKVSIK